MFKWMAGYRTYAAVAAMAAVAVAQAFGYPIPEWVYAVLGAAGLGGLRAATPSK
jgi:hypothetical protein